MNADDLDAIARSILLNATRRRALLSSGSAVIAGLSPALIPAGIQARKKRKKKRCCKADCAGKLCGDDGCGGVCGFVCQESEPGKICCEGICKYPNGTPGCCIPSGEVCTPEGVTHGSYVCCSKSCDIGNTNLCD